MATTTPKSGRSKARGPVEGPEARDPALTPTRDVVVIVDDDLPVLASLRRLLRHEPFEVLTTDRPEQALEWIEHRDVSLIVTDYWMPGISGIDLLLAVQERSPTTERILLTGYPGERVVLKGVGQGLLWLLAKPWNNEELRGMIRARLRERRRLEEKMLQAGEQERERIAQDLHDALGQDLAGLSLLCAALEDRLTARGSPEAAAAGRISHLVQNALTKARTMARGLSPVGLRDGNLGSDLERMASGVRVGFGVECDLRWDGPPAFRDPSVATHLYWIVQEALTNAVRHGKPRRIRIDARRQGGLLRVAVEDDGSGIPETPAGASGIGLQIMRSRAQAIGAALRVGRRPGGGTEVVCEIPLEGKDP